LRHLTKSPWSHACGPQQHGRAHDSLFDVLLVRNQIHSSIVDLLVLWDGGQRTVVKELDLGSNLENGGQPVSTAQKTQSFSLSPLLRGHITTVRACVTEDLPFDLSWCADVPVWHYQDQPATPHAGFAVQRKLTSSGNGQYE